MKIRTFWQISQANKIFLENLPFNRNISMEIDNNGKFPFLDKPIETMVNQVKIVNILNGHGGQMVRAVACYA
jgi:hypothetical protein